MSIDHPINQIERRAVAFHKDNQHVYARFEALMLKACRVRDHVSARQAWHVMRWDMSFETTETMPNPDDSTRTLKLNDHYSPYYARWFADEYPQYADKFSFREVDEEDPAEDAARQISVEFTRPMNFL